MTSLGFNGSAAICRVRDLWEAAKEGDLATVEELLRRSPDRVNESDTADGPSLSATRQPRAPRRDAAALGGG